MSQGWISLHRKVMQNPIFTERRTFSKFEAWIWLLLRANHCEGKVLIGNQMVKVERGSLITSQHQLCKIFNWGTTKLRAFLKLLQSETMIEWESLPKATCITINNYGSYQNLQTDNKAIPKQNQTTNKLESKPNNNVKQKETIGKREQKFINLVCSIAMKENYGNQDYTPELIDDFCNYWGEKNLNGTKMKFEMQKTFDISKRLRRWANNKKEWGTENKTKYQYEDFKFDTTGYNKMAYCSKCGKHDFFKKPQYEDCRAQGCGGSLQPERNIENV